jgi:hypothetical protein
LKSILTCLKPILTCFKPILGRMNPIHAMIRSNNTVTKFPSPEPERKTFILAIH